MLKRKYKSHKSYNSSSNLILRDHLALERTHLANQRTFLSFIRTSLTMIVLGFSLYKLFDGYVNYLLSGTLIGFAILAFTTGVKNYIETDVKLEECEYPNSKQEPKLHWVAMALLMIADKIPLIHHRFK